MTTFPILYVEDVARAVSFYERAFGFERTYEWRDGETVEFAALRREDSYIGLGLGEGRGGFELCIYVEDVDAAALRLRDLGAAEVAAAEDQPWGERRAYFDDPDGHRLHVTAKITR